jgi:hypothetical protein
MTPVIRIDDEVMNELKRRAVDLGLVFEPPNATLRRVLGLDARAELQAPATLTGKRQRFGRVHTATPVRDTTTGQVYPSKYKAGLAFIREFPSINRRYVWYALIHKYPGRFVEVASSTVLGETGSSREEQS